MGTVLWSNTLKEGEVVSDHVDLYAMFKYLDKLDGICKAIGVRTLSSICDNTDMLVNLEQLEMPDDYQDTNQMMAEQGVWVQASEAQEILEKLLVHIQSHDTRFGLLKNVHDDIVEELKICSQFAGNAANCESKFNFSIVM
jgi:predicted small metal-binding protein